MFAEAARLKCVVDEALTYMKGESVQIGFFGGSFTGIEPERMRLLLDTAYDYIKNGQVSGIRLSTRPDYINEEVLALLKSRGVTDIELGMQSTDDEVLKASGRGHDRDVCFESSELIVKHGFSLGCQMMIGLPCSTAEKELQTATDIISMGAVSARIYPTVVFVGTALYDMVLEGKYCPLDNENAVRRSAACAKLFVDAGVDILRIGLHSSNELAMAPFGANHPAMGELVYSRLAYEKIVSAIGDVSTDGKILKVFTSRRGVSSAAGYGGENKIKLKSVYGFKKIKVFEENGLEGIKVQIEAEE